MPGVVLGQADEAAGVGGGAGDDSTGRVAVLHLSGEEAGDSACVCQIGVVLQGSHGEATQNLGVGSVADDAADGVRVARVGPAADGTGEVGVYDGGAGGGDSHEAGGDLGRGGDAGVDDAVAYAAVGYVTGEVGHETGYVAARACEVTEEDLAVGHAVGVSCQAGGVGVVCADGGTHDLTSVDETVAPGHQCGVVLAF